MRRIIYLLLIAVCLASRATSRAWHPAEPYRAPVSPAVVAPTPDRLTTAISTAQLAHHICKLQDRDDGPYCNDVGSRYVWHEDGQREARRYIYDALRALGLAVSYDPFVQRGATLYNVVATLPGRDPASDLVYIIVAHYDSVSSVAGNGGPAPGADDNASGVAALLEIARLLSGSAFAHTIRFLAVTGEETGLWGSAHYAAAARARGENIAGVINLDMIGYDHDADGICEVHAGTDPASIALADAFVAHAQRASTSLQPLVFEADAITLSDHASFWRQGYPAILVIEGLAEGEENPNYHRVTDTLAHLSLPYLADIAGVAAATLAELAEPWYVAVWLPGLAARQCVSAN